MRIRTESQNKRECRHWSLEVDTRGKNAKKETRREDFFEERIETYDGDSHFQKEKRREGKIKRERVEVNGWDVHVFQGRFEGLVFSSSNNPSKNILDKMADDPFSIWGEPTTTTTTATTSNINDTSKSSLDFFDSLAGASASTSTSSHQPSTKLFADDSLSNDATWGQPPSPAAIPEKERDEDENLIPEIHNIDIQDKIQHPESSLVEEEEAQIPIEPKDEINGTGQDENAVETAPEAKQIEIQEDEIPISSTTVQPSDPSEKEESIEQDDFHNSENINPDAQVKVEEQEQQPSTSTFISPPPASSTKPVPPDDDFDDFDDFGESNGNAVGEADDDFGDFGDFDDGALPKEEPLQIQREQVVQQQQPTNAANWVSAS